MESGKPLDFMKAGKYDAAIVSDYDYCGGILATAAGIPSIMSFTATNIMYSQTQHIGLPNPSSCVSGEQIRGSQKMIPTLLLLVLTSKIDKLITRNLKLTARRKENMYWGV